MHRSIKLDHPVTFSCTCQALDISGVGATTIARQPCFSKSNWVSADVSAFFIVQHAVTFAAGLAAEGMIPMCAIYSSFLQRGYDQIVHDVALQKLPVRFAMDRAGLVGADGATHSGFADVTYMGVLPNMVIMAVRSLLTTHFKLPIFSAFAGVVKLGRVV